MCQQDPPDECSTDADTSSPTKQATGSEEQLPIEPNSDQNSPSNSASSSPPVSCTQRVIAFYWEQEFLLLVIAAILLARAYPPLGATYLAPDITATWLAVCFIFVMAGLGLKTEEFSKALQRVYFNGFVQMFNFGVVSSIIYGLSRALEAGNILGQDLADGMVVCASLPMTINMVLVLTKSSGGDEAAAIFNAAFGNLIGVFLSPVLILGYLGVTGDIDLFEVFYKLALRVVVPVIVGQILQKKSKTVVEFVKKHKHYFKQAQQYCLVFIVYTVFCKTFEEESQSSIGDIFLMIAFQFLFLMSLMVLAWYTLGVLFRDEPTLRVMGLFGCTHKTVAMGVPLINAIYGDDPAVGSYTLPLLIWHPMQLVVGTILAPRLSAYVDRERERLGWADATIETGSGEYVNDNENHGDEEQPTSYDGSRLISHQTEK
ncbi:predicted protein [Phaeodactylum tricornutum CCAP 1055/1]|jgi:sodium/bile acid cotransporter 7|uniref:Uncharacterized protein n=2 Tax=Phaeodactylum tricornutum TaxID=2850 RepID=B7G617_PHATC|nr:predicted protein [Phaeodactylum tricornutum CCAP 1055/1]EEC45933.1 predicted protein [Phaeodactylum tricornutum CCAP 1055/1]|eukprot:XP_002182646.1 predicted protein [Phaeodactylum tricornutum CCAP 1055/1]